MKAEAQFEKARIVATENFMLGLIVVRFGAECEHKIDIGRTLLYVRTSNFDMEWKNDG